MKTTEVRDIYVRAVTIGREGQVFCIQCRELVQHINEGPDESLPRNERTDRWLITLKPCGHTYLMIATEARLLYETS